MPPRPEHPATRALAWLYSPAAERVPFAALCALEAEVALCLRPGLEHAVAHARLAWWREECARCRAGAATHPLTRAVAAAFAAAAPDALDGLAGLTDAVAWDLAAATFADRAELTGYCARWSAAIFEPLARRATPAAALGTLRALGRSLRELELLVDLAPEARAGRLRLPLAELEAAKLSPAALATPPWDASLAALVRARHRSLRAALAGSVDSLGAPVQPALRGLIVWAALVTHASRRAETRLPWARATREDHAPLDGWRAWRAARRALAGRGLPPEP